MKGFGLSRGLRRPLAAVCLGVGVISIAACGSAKGSSPVAATRTSTASAAHAGRANGKTFPVFRVAIDSGIDYLDPGLSYTTEGWSVLWNVYLPLLGYKHVNGSDGATIVPYLARALPTISADGKTYTLWLRKGLKYSNGAPVKASDFKATIERDYEVDSTGGGFFDNIVGAAQYGKAKKGSISGIETDDATGRITIHLLAPQGDFENILATEFAAPVPASAPANDTSTRPLPSTGPYMIRSYSPNRQIVEVRNPHFDARALRNVPSGNPDRIVWDVVGDDAASLDRVIAGQDDWNGYHAIPARRVASVLRRYHAQLRTYLQPATYYFFMNTAVKPFTSLLVRQAVNYAIDRNALVAIYGSLASATENILPPGDPQYRRHDFYPHDLAKARRLVARSGFKGSHVIVWTHQLGPDALASEYLVRVLHAIGFRARISVVNSAVYWTTIGNRSMKAQIGFADWMQDYPHPLGWFDVLLNGDRITPSHNSDYANFDDPAVNAEIEALRRQPHLTKAVNRRWAELDAEVMEQAPWAPFLNRRFVDFFARKVDLGCYVNQVVYGFDYATICMK
jgi:peptide/nickel transport system substrate-binding protein